MVGLRPNVPIKDMKQTCQKMLRQLAEPKGWIIGKTKVIADSYESYQLLETRKERSVNFTGK